MAQTVRGVWCMGSRIFFSMLWVARRWLLLGTKSVLAEHGEQTVQKTAADVPPTRAEGFGTAARFLGGKVFEAERPVKDAHRASYAQAARFRHGAGADFIDEREVCAEALGKDNRLGLAPRLRRRW